MSTGMRQRQNESRASIVSGSVSVGSAVAGFISEFS